MNENKKNMEYKGNKKTGCVKNTIETEEKNDIINFGFSRRIMLLAGVIFIGLCLSVSASAFSQVEVNTLLNGEYTNSQCFLCYDICQDTVTDLSHEMYENLTIDKKGVVSSKNTLVQKDVEEALKNNYTIKYSVYTDYLPPTFLKDKTGNLVDSRYRGEMIFSGGEYFVKSWDDSGKILKIAKGEKIKINNQEFSGNFTAKNGTYRFKIHRVLFAEDNVAGIVIDVEKPDKTQVQVIAQRSLNAVVSDVEIYASNVAMAGDFATADVTLYDLSTEIILEDGEWLTGKKEWYVELEDVDLGCLANLGDGAKGSCGGGSSWISSENSNARDKFSVYELVNKDYGSACMLKTVRLTLNPVLQSCTQDSDCETGNCVKGVCRKEGYGKKDSSPAPRGQAYDKKERENQIPSRSYVNNQCFLCYDICQDTVIDLEHDMYETITVNGDTSVYEEGLDEGILKDTVESAGEGDAVKYSVYTEYLPPTFLKDKDGNLVDSRYRGKMLFLGEEYQVKDWDDNEKTLKIAKGKERKIDNKAFGGDFTTKNGTYQFKIHRAIYSEDSVAGVVINVKKPDGTEIQAIAQRSLNAVVGGVEIYVSNIATAGSFATADIMVYDLTTEILLKDNEEITVYNKVWIVEMQDTALGCIAYISGDSVSVCTSGSESEWETKSNSAGINAGDREKFKDYGAADKGYAGEGMLKEVNLILKTGPAGELHSSGSKEPDVKYGSDTDRVLGQDAEKDVEPESEKTAYIGGLTVVLIAGLIGFMVLVIAAYLVMVKKK